MRVFIMPFDLFLVVTYRSCLHGPLHLVLFFLGIASGIGDTEVVRENNVFPRMFSLSSEAFCVCISPFLRFPDACDYQLLTICEPLQLITH